jgi:hypothetical protein
MKNKTAKNLPNQLIAECCSVPTSEITNLEIRTQKEIDDQKIMKKIDATESDLFKFIDNHILTGNRKLSDIWSVAYGDLFRHISTSQELLGIYVLHHIFYNQELFSDEGKVEELRNDLDTNFWEKEKESEPKILH